MRERLTQSDIDKMQQEIDYRAGELRTNLIEAVKVARAQGDLSENFEYYAAKREKNRNESRIRYLENMIKTARIIEDHSGEDEVGMNTKVTVFVEEDNAEETYKIVTTIRSDTLKGLISIESPVGKALLGKKVGDRVKIDVNDSYSYYVQIRKIDKTLADENDRILGH